MVPDIKPFLKFLRQRDAKKAREWLEFNKGNLSPENEFERGYLLALQGMVSALESGGELSAINRVLEKKYTLEQIAELIRETRARLSQKFRPKDEQGFDTAWVDVLKELSGEKT